MYYEKWIDIYQDYLSVMYNDILSRYHDINKITFDDFCNFMYIHTDNQHE